MLNRSASLAMSTCVLKALPGKLDIKRHSPSILYVSLHGILPTHVYNNFKNHDRNLRFGFFKYATKWRGINGASSRENLSSGFPTKRVSNQSPQLQRLARKMKFRL